MEGERGNREILGEGGRLSAGGDLEGRVKVEEKVERWKGDGTGTGERERGE